jgi:hypothetical protein
MAIDPATASNAIPGPELPLFQHDALNLCRRSLRPHRLACVCKIPQSIVDDIKRIGQGEAQMTRIYSRSAGLSTLQRPHGPEYSNGIDEKIFSRCSGTSAILSANSMTSIWLI